MSVLQTYFFNPCFILNSWASMYLVVVWCGDVSHGEVFIATYSSRDVACTHLARQLTRNPDEVRAGSASVVRMLALASLYWRGLD